MDTLLVPGTRALFLSGRKLLIKCLHHPTSSLRYLHDCGDEGFERAVDSDDEDVEAISAQQARADASGERRPAEEMEGKMGKRLACQTQQKSFLKELETNSRVSRTNKIAEQTK